MNSIPNNSRKNPLFLLVLLATIGCQLKDNMKLVPNTDGKQKENIYVDSTKYPNVVTARVIDEISNFCGVYCELSDVNGKKDTIYERKDCSMVFDVH